MSEHAHATMPSEILELQIQKMDLESSMVSLFIYLFICCLFLIYKLGKFFLYMVFLSTI